VPPAYETSAFARRWIYVSSFAGAIVWLLLLPALASAGSACRLKRAARRGWSTVNR